MTRTLTCLKYGENQEGLEKPPLPGAMGERIYNEVSARAWQEWQQLQTMLINEKELSLIDPDARKYLTDQMWKFFQQRNRRPCGGICSSRELTQPHHIALIRRSREIAHGQIAQSVEQGTENPRVDSSILSLATISLSETFSVSRPSLGRTDTSRVDPTRLPVRFCLWPPSLETFSVSRPSPPTRPVSTQRGCQFDSVSGHHLLKLSP